ncbi:prepilin peptidase [Alicyclobacillus sp. SO9]|nr:prepilin peptidase [Alicyclobacillus sp. SO9]
MWMQLGASWAVLLVVLTAASWVDIRTQRIPNLLLVAGVVAGLVLRVGFGGAHGFLEALLGFGIGLLAGLLGERLPIGMGRWGMGDAKTLAVMGVCLGWFGVVITAFGAGILLAVIRLTSLTLHKPMRTLAFVPVLAVSACITMGVEFGVFQWLRM